MQKNKTLQQIKCLAGVRRLRRVERLKEITSEDAIKESANEWFIEHGLSWKDSDKPYSIYAFQHLWDSLYTKKPELQWEANPWVWVVEFRELSQKPLETRI